MDSAEVYGPVCVMIYYTCTHSDLKLQQKYRNSLLYEIKIILQNGAYFVLRNNMLNYFVICYLKSKLCCFAAFLKKKCGISNIARAIFLKYICKMRLLYNQGIFLLIEENDCTAIQK